MVLIRKTIVKAGADKQTAKSWDGYEATPITVLKESASEEDKTFGSSNRGEHLDVEEGTNKFRIFPKHKGEKTYYIIKVVHWLSVANDEGEIGRRSVLDSRYHSTIDQDIIDEYCKGATDFLKKKEEDEEIDLGEVIKLANSSWDNGLGSSASWLCYAKKVLKSGVERGILECKKSVRDGMNRITNTEDVDQPIVVDPFTDPKTGIPILVTYTPKAKQASKKYSVDLSKHEMPLTDEDFAWFEKMKPLEEVFSNAYSKNQFDLALEGLKNFDEENEVGYFETEEFQAKIEELQELLDFADEDDEASGKKKPGKKETKKAPKKLVKVAKKEEPDEEPDEEPEDDLEPEEEAEEEGVDLSTMDRSELKAFIKDNALNIVVMKGWEDDEIRYKIVAAMGVVEETEPEEEPEEDEEEVKPKVTGTVKKPQTLQDIKAKLQSSASKPKK